MKHTTYQAGLYNLGWTELRVVRLGANSKKRSGGVRAPTRKTGYISIIFTAWGEPKFALDHLFAS
jgi:hypothetical protein